MEGSGGRTGIKRFAKRRSEVPFYYGWVIVAISFYAIFLAMGLRYSFGVFFTAIIDEYGWGRGETAGAFSLAMLVHACFLPATGVLIDRLGPRRLFPLGAVLFSLGLAAASQIKVLWHLYLFFGVFISIGVNTLSYSPHMSVIPRWFIRKRGFATGLVMSGIGLGTAVLAPLNGAIIDHIGWRSCFLLLAAIAFVTLVPGTAVLQRRSPSEVGQYPDGFRSERNGSSPLESGTSGGSTRLLLPKIWTLRSALQTRSFWCFFLSVFCNGFAINFFVVHQVAIIVDMGYSNLMAASLVGLTGLAGSMSGILCGFISDYAGRWKLYTLAGLSALFAIFFLSLQANSGSPWIIYTFAVFYGFGYGSLGPMIAAATGDLFPGNSLGRILATQAIGYSLGAALGPYVGGYFYDQKSSYSLAFVLCIIAIGTSILSMWLAGPSRTRITHRRADGKIM